MLIKRPNQIAASEITDEALWHERRSFLRGGAAAALGITVPSIMPTSVMADMAVPPLPDFTKNAAYSTDEKLTPYDSVTGYNNFYEFGLDKRDPAKFQDSLKTRPWSLEVVGECENPKTWDIDDVLKTFDLEERIYRLRCVEAWSMVVPWIGFELGALIKAAKPTSRAKYVRMETLVDPVMFPGQTRGLFGSSLKWPYVEGLRMDEAMHPLTIMAVGLYGKTIPNQNGAPIRLVVPWKYGFKSIKSIVKIEFTEEEPKTTWNAAAAREYGFYANVNPEVDHPRWSQAKERRVGNIGKQPTLPFNGYAEEVAGLYSGMDLTKFY